MPLATIVNPPSKRDERNVAVLGINFPNCSAGAQQHYDSLLSVTNAAGYSTVECVNPTMILLLFAAHLFVV